MFHSSMKIQDLADLVALYVFGSIERTAESRESHG